MLHLLLIVTAVFAQLSVSTASAAENCQSDVTAVTPAINEDVCLMIIQDGPAPTVVKTERIEPTEADTRLVETDGRIETATMTAIAD